MPTVECPKCSQRLKAPAEAIGKKAKCTGCGATFVIPRPEVEPPAILLAPVEPPPVRAKSGRWLLVIGIGVAAVVGISVLGGLFAVVGSLASRPAPPKTLHALKEQLAELNLKLVYYKNWKHDGWAFTTRPLDMENLTPQEKTLLSNTPPA